MKAKLVSESINFERGLDPKDAMGIGDKEFQRNKKIKAKVKKLGKNGKILREMIIKLRSIFKEYLPFDQKQHSSYAIEDMQSIWWWKIVEPGWSPKSIDVTDETSIELEEKMWDLAIKLLGIPHMVIEL